MSTVLNPVLAKLLGGSKLDSLPVAVKFWNGERIGPDDARVTLTFKNASALKVLLKPSAGKLTRAYVEETIDIEGALREVIAFGTSLRRVTIGRAAMPLLGAWHSLSSDRKAVQFHYDVSNDFYALWLDRNMVYSCGYFRGDADTLDEAQEQKLEHICRKLCLKPDDWLLDIGCGWGGLILWAAEHYRARCVGITLSQKQHAYVSEKIRERGLDAYCEVRLADYREVDSNERFDKIASVGMFEHVGRRNLKTYFQQIHRLLEPGGLLLNHGISASWAKGQALTSEIGDFIDRHVFPDGELVSIAEAIAEMSAVGLESRDVESLRPHYAKTLWHWVERLDRSAPTARELVGERAYRICRIYMAGSAFAFERGWISVYQVLAGRPHSNGELPYPPTREHLYHDLTPPHATGRSSLAVMP